MAHKCVRYVHTCAIMHTFSLDTNISSSNTTVVFPLCGEEASNSGHIHTMLINVCAITGMLELLKVVEQMVCTTTGAYM